MAYLGRRERASSALAESGLFEYVLRASMTPLHILHDPNVREPSLEGRC